MTILHAGGELGSFFPSDSSVSEVTNNGGYWDPAYARCGLMAGPGSGIQSSYAHSSQFASVTSIWLHFELANCSPAYTQAPARLVSLFNGAQEVFYIQGINPTQQTFNYVLYTMWYWNGSGFVQIGGTFQVNANKQTFDLNVVFGASGSASLYCAGTLQLSGSANLAGPSCNQYRVWSGGNFGSNQGVVYSQMIASTTPTVGMKLYTIPITGPGLSAGWVGLYTDINEIAINDGTYLSSSVPASLANYACSAAVSGTILAVVVSARAVTQVGAPQNLQMAINTGGVDYTSPNILQTLGFQANVYVWQTNPGSSAPWVPGNINAAFYYGIKSAA